MRDEHRKGGNLVRAAPIALLGMILGAGRVAADGARRP